MMGTTASTAQQTVSASAFESVHGIGTMEDQRSLSIHSFQTLGLHNSKAKSIITNKVAPVVITYNCREEFQIHDDLLKANYTVGRISEATLEHYLVQGKYFMVRDVYSKLDVLNTMSTSGAPNFRQAKGGYAVFGMGQPSLNGFKLVLQKLQREGHKECVFFCVREEPVLFLRVESDFVPYTPRGKENLHENLHSLQRRLRVEDLELTIRKEIHDFAQLSEGVYYVYNDIERFRDEPHTVRVQSEEDIHVTEEVYRRPIFLLPTYRYHRLPLPVDGAPLEEQFDAFICFLRESPGLLLRDPSCPPPALLFSCQTGVGRTNLGMALGTLILYHHRGAAPKPDPPHPAKTPPRARFRVIQSFIEMVPKGQQMVEEVDSVIASCSEMHDMKEAIYESKKKLEGIGEDYQIQGNSTKEYFLQRTLQSLERYFYLIAFNYYLHEQYPLGFALSFSRWMCQHPELYRLQASMNSSELTISGDLITKGTRVLVVDERFCPDVLSTVKEMSVANFRRVPKMPIYGTAQPSSKALGSVLRYLTDAKRKHSHILWVSLREEVVLEGNEQIYTLREPGKLDQLIPVPVSTPEQLEKLESTLKGDLLKSQKWLEVYLEAEKQMKMFKSCLTTQEIFNQHKSTCQGLTYRRIPIPDFCAPKEQVAALPPILKLPLVGLRAASEAPAVLPVFQVVMKVVQLLPDGHRMKKEVDMALDTVSETMTPMHYHLREIIICTYRQGRSGKDEQERRLLRLRGLQYLERYIYLILFNAYLHLEKKDSWQRPFSLWMREVAAVAGVYEVLDGLGFPELEQLEDEEPLRRLRGRWRAQSGAGWPSRGNFV
ncbi:paladin [Meleagris gallopavo]|uniref:paladin n=1 Tax=Meleagris gallopavo TaxID=9103 RepID=UPI00093929E5|nr:paladin [Meleagris gallopavo]